MLSTKTLTPSADQHSYYMSSDNYYAKDSIEGQERSGWFGKGAAQLGLSGLIDKEVFSDLIQGILPTGQALGVIKDGVRKHRPGFDLTFSVPKSVSIVSLMGNDPRILQAIHESVDKVLAVIEKEAAQARTTQNGETVYEDTGNIVAAKFLHDLSRECDPQLHVHTVVMNMTERSDGKWRALASQMGKYGQDAKNEVNGFIERVRHQKKYYGLLFNAELAFALKELGYELDINKKTGQFEIAGISEASLRTFSQRREQIEKVMQEKGFTSAKAAAVVTLETRKNKEEVDRAALRETWKARCNDRSLDTFKEAQEAVNKSLQPNSTGEKEKTSEVYDVQLLEQLLADFNRDQPSFTQNQLMNTLLSTHLDKFISLEAARGHIAQLVENNQLFIRETDKGETLYVTKQRIDAEKDLVLSATKTRSNLSTRRQGKLDRVLTKNIDSPVQSKISTALQSNALIHAIEVIDESQKLKSIAPLVKLSQASGLQPIILSQSAKSSQKINSVIQSQYGWFRQFISNLTDNSQTLTVSKFLYCMKNEAYQGFFNGYGGALIIEDAERLSIENMNDLIKIAESTDSKIIPIFNDQGIKHWSNNQAIDLLKKSGLSIEKLPSESSNSKEDVSEFSSSRLQSLMDGTLSHDSEEKALEALVDHANNFVRSNVNARVVLPNRRLAQQFNELTREKRLASGLLSQEHVHATQLLPVHLKTSEFASSKSYKAGMVVRFNENYHSINVAKEEYLTVIESHDRTNQVVLETDSGERVVWNPNKVGGRKQGAIELYDKVVSPIHLGEKLKISRGLRYKGLVSGDVVTVTGFKENKLMGLTDNGKRVSLSLLDREEQHYAISYCDSAYQSIPKNTDVILTYHAGHAPPFASNMLRSLMTHIDKKVWCYTLNRDKLFSEMQKALPEAHYALDYVVNAHENTYVESVKKALAEGIQSHFQEYNTESIASEAILYAMKHLSEREAAFSQNELLSIAMKNVLGSAAPNEVHEALRLAETSGYLIPGVVSRDGKLWTTVDALQEENALLTIAKKGVNQLTPISTPIGVKAYLEKSILSFEQKEAIETLCTNTNRVIPIQGLAGVGKTTMMKAFVEICQQHHHEMIILAPTHTAVKELRANGLSAQTLDSFLKSNAHETAVESQISTSTTKSEASEKSYPIFILDEATMAATKRQCQLAKIVEARGGKFIPVGDVFQFSSIEAGKAHENFQSIGIEVVKMTDIQRQRNNPELLSAVRSTYELNYEDAFAQLGDRIIEIGQEKIGDRLLDNADARLMMMADEFIQLPPEERQHMLMITLSNAERVVLNDKIRQGLIKNGELAEQAIQSNILRSKDMTQVELTRASNYALHDVVLFGVSQSALGVKKGDYLTVVETNTQKNTLALQRGNGDKVMFQLPSSRNKTHLALSVYQKEERDLRIGDWIRWTKSNPTLGLLSPEYALVTNVEGNNAICQPMTFTKEGPVIDNTFISISPNDAQYSHWDYAYAVTNYASQGRSILKVRGSFPSEHPKLTTQRAFLVTETRAIADIKIYTDNKTKLLNHLLVTPGDKTSALEAIGKLQAMDKKSVIKKQKAGELLEKSASKEAVKTAQREQKSVMIDSQKLRKAMNDQAETIAISLLGEPKERQGNSLRFGTHKGSLIVTIKGQKQGLWHDFQTGEGGDILRLFAEQKGLHNAQDYPQLLSEASRYLGVDLSTSTPHMTLKKSSERVQEQDKSDPKNWTDHQKKQVAKANKLAKESLPAKGSLVENYLKEHRKIDLKNLPQDVRFHPNIYCAMNKKSYPAMLLLGRDKAGNIQVVQATFLDQTTKNKPENLTVSKQTIGVISGAAVHLSLPNDKQKANGQPTKSYIAEGAETGLSALMADQKNEVKVTMGQSNFLSTHKLNLQENVVFCFDNDAKNSPENRFKVQAERLQSEGKSVTYLKPEKVGHDLNDVLKEKGVEHLKTLLTQEKSFSAEHKAIDHIKQDLTLQSRIKNGNKQQAMNRVLAQQKTMSSSQKQLNQIKGLNREMGH